MSAVSKLSSAECTRRASKTVVLSNSLMEDT
jgi:hypothetical protein